MCYNKKGGRVPERSPMAAAIAKVKINYNYLKTTPGE
jgi:hypothetical protein